MNEVQDQASEARQHQRVRVPAMYTLLRARATGDARYRWTGYVYDVSLSGLRFELDEALPSGTQLDIRAMLPGQQHTTFRATGTVVRKHDDEDEPGPVRMGMHFDRFAHHTDQMRLREFITQKAA